MDVTKFKQDCIDKKPDIIVQEHLIDGTSFFFDEIQKGKEFEFKKDLARSLDVHIRDIVIVGSGKLGFSIKPDIVTPSLYQYKKFDFNYERDNGEKKSDLDIAIVSGSLFDRQLVNIYDHTNSYSTDNSYKGSNKNAFAKYILKGWLVPKYIPEDYSLSLEIDAVQEKYKMEYGRDINIGIYKSWYFFENYHQNNIKNIQLNLIAE